MFTGDLRSSCGRKRNGAGDASPRLVNPSGLAFLACRPGIRPGEVRALDLGDFDGEKTLVSKAVKGPNANAPVRGTKSHKVRPAYADALLLEWLRWRIDQVAPEARTQGRVPLFPNPSARNREKRWIANALREE